MSAHHESSEVETETRGSTAHAVRLTLAAVLLAVVIAVAVDNRRETSIGYVVGDVRAPLILVLVIAALLGAAIGWLFMHRPHHR